MTTTITTATRTMSASTSCPAMTASFPGWDQNNDFIPDFNQNDNAVRANRRPDYDEPFLRFDVDRPEFLFGVDMNNNFWVDQFENDGSAGLSLPQGPQRVQRICRV